MQGALRSWGWRVLLCALVISWGVLAAGQHVEAVFPTDDTYVHQGNPHEAHGGEAHLELASEEEANRRVLLKFDLTEVRESISRATLHLYFYWGSGFTALRDDGVLVEVRAVDEDNWGEEALTWADAPPAKELLTSSPIGVSGRWLSFDISEFAAAQAGEKKEISLVLLFSREDYDATNRRIRFRSKEHGEPAERPYLELEYGQEEPDPGLRHTLTVSANPSEGGTVAVDGEEVSLPHEGEYEEATVVELRAVPAASWELAQWEVDGEEAEHADGLIVLQMDEDRQAIARFQRPTHTITATAGAGGSIVPAGEVAVGHGEEQTFTIAPAEGQNISDVVVDAGSVLDELVFVNGEATYTVSGVTSDHTIHATFIVVSEVALTVEVFGRGQVEVDGAPYTAPVCVPRGTAVELSALPAEGSAFARWGDGSTEVTRTIVVSEDITVRAYFRIEPYCVAVGPHPVSSEGGVFWLSLPGDAVAATLTLFAVDGAALASFELDPQARRYPAVGRWKPRDSRGRLLGTGLYLCLVEVRHEDGGVSHCPVKEVVIDR